MKNNSKSSFSGPKIKSGNATPLFLAFCIVAFGSSEILKNSARAEFDAFVPDGNQELEELIQNEVKKIGTRDSEYRAMIQGEVDKALDRLRF